MAWRISACSARMVAAFPGSGRCNLRSLSMWPERRSDELPELRVTDRRAERHVQASVEQREARQVSALDEGQPLLGKDLLSGRKLLLVGVESQGANGLDLDGQPQELRLPSLGDVDLGHDRARLRVYFHEILLLQLQEGIAHGRLAQAVGLREVGARQGFARL